MTRPSPDFFDEFYDGGKNVGYIPPYFTDTLNLSKNQLLLRARAPPLIGERAK